MPKVKQEYFEHKKDAILDAAFAVCKNKPMHQVTMKDIIRESGISQGGIYRYYKNVDEVLVAVINRSLGDKNYKEKIDKITAGSRNPAETLEELLKFLADYINDNIDTLGKFQFELTELHAYNPERIKNIYSKNKHADSMMYLADQLFCTIRSGVESGYFKPVLPVNDILNFVSISIDGIVLDGVLHRCYGLPLRDFGFNINTLLHTLTCSTLNLLSPNDKADDKKSNVIGDGKSEQ